MTIMLTHFTYIISFSKIRDISEWSVFFSQVFIICRFSQLGEAQLLSCPFKFYSHIPDSHLNICVCHHLILYSSYVLQNIDYEEQSHSYCISSRQSISYIWWLSHFIPTQGINCNFSWTTRVIVPLLIRSQSNTVQFCENSRNRQLLQNIIDDFKFPCVNIRLNCEFICFAVNENS